MDEIIADIRLNSRRDMTDIRISHIHVAYAQELRRALHRGRSKGAWEQAKRRAEHRSRACARTHAQRRYVWRDQPANCWAGVLQQLDRFLLFQDDARPAALNLGLCDRILLNYTCVNEYGDSVQQSVHIL